MKAIKKRCSFLLIMIAISMINMAAAQDTVIVKADRGTLDSINSTILNQKRLIEVFTPENYKPGGTTKYDVLYVLDGGNWNTGMIMQIQQYLEGNAYIPPTIIVSVLGIDRNKDLTPTHVDGWNTSGGADKFLGFIKNELIPYVNKTYPSNGDNTLWGHSLGGLFAMYALLNEPGTFKSYIAVDPSLWWDNGNLDKGAINKLKNMPDVNASLYVSYRDKAGYQDMRIGPMDSILIKSAPPGLAWKINSYSDETHSSIRLKSTYDGLRFIYSDYNDATVDFHPMNGIVLKNKPIQIRYFDNLANIYYTTDGSTPTPTSAKMQPEVMLSAPATFTAKLFAKRDRYSKTTTGYFKPGTTPRPSKQEKDLTAGGFDYAYYEGKWDSLPDFKSLKPVQTGSIQKLDINKLPRKNDFALLINGQLETKEDGYYFFLLDADAGSKLYIGNQLIIQSDSIHTRRKSYILPLAKGFYPLRFEYLHKQGDRKLRVMYMTPSTMDTKKPTPIPIELQYGHH